MRLQKVRTSPPDRVLFQIKTEVFLFGRVASTLFCMTSLASLDSGESPSPSEGMPTSCRPDAVVGVLLDEEPPGLVVCRHLYSIRSARAVCVAVGPDVARADDAFWSWACSSADSISNFADSGWTCSQNRSTFQPSARSSRSVDLSLSMFCFNLGTQYSWLDFGIVPCSGQPCQKQPSTNTAVFNLVNAMSAWTIFPPDSRIG